YRGYKIKNGESGTLPFMFFDTMGVEKGYDKGVDERDMNNALHGHLPDGHELKFTLLSKSDIKYRDPAADQSGAHADPLCTTENVNNGHISIRTGPQSNGRRWPGLMNHIFF
ncbi:hypothetical protein QTP70_023837, partial [Hemibagrus guttatus]